MKYRMTPEDGLFRMNTMGDVFAEQRLYHTRDKHQYRYIVTASDSPNLLSSTAEVFELLTVITHKEGSDF